MPSQTKKLGLIAGNGKFPFLVLDAARAQGYEVVVAAIKEEAFPEIESHGAAAVHWLSLGELSKLIETFQREGVRRADHGGAGAAQADFFQHPAGLAAGQAFALAHDAQYRFAAGRGGEGAGAMKASCWRNPRGCWSRCWSKPGVLTQREPTEQERKNIEYGRVVAPAAGAARHWADGGDRRIGVRRG